MEIPIPTVNTIRSVLKMAVERQGLALEEVVYLGVVSEEEAGVYVEGDFLLLDYDFHSLNPTLRHGYKALVYVDGLSDKTMALARMQKVSGHAAKLAEEATLDRQAIAGKIYGRGGHLQLGTPYGSPTTGMAENFTLLSTLGVELINPAMLVAYEQESRAYANAGLYFSERLKLGAMLNLPTEREYARVELNDAVQGYLHARHQAGELYTHYDQLVAGYFQGDIEEVYELGLNMMQDILPPVDYDRMYRWWRLHLTGEIPGQNPSLD